MAKVGYIFKADHYDNLEQDKTWMEQFGCVRVVEELSTHEKLRRLEATHELFGTR
jgi:hypothetical protein